MIRKLVFEMSLVEKFLKYCLVGILGTAIDAGSLVVFTELLHLPLSVGITLSFILAASSNFYLNKKWTFADGSPQFTKQYAKFMSVSVVGLISTLIIMWFLVSVIGLWYLPAKLLTSGIVLAFNFSANSLFTFRKKLIPNA